MTLTLDTIRNELNSIMFKAIGREDKLPFIASELRQIAERIEEEEKPLWSR